MTDDDDWAEMRKAMKVLERGRQRRWRAAGYRKEPRTARLPELDPLEVPVILPGEQAPEKPAKLGIYAYDPEGRLIPGEYIDASRQAMGYKFIPGYTQWRSRTFYRAGAPLHVSTVYLGLDHSFFPYEPPLIWETMVFSGFYWDVYSTRYATRGAALHGHRMITAAVRQAQVDRRTAMRSLAPRRPVVLS